jgi:hypothetical protein
MQRGILNLTLILGDNMFRTPTIELNEYIETFAEIKPHLDQLIENINIEEVLIINNGCNKSRLVRKIFNYLHDHDIRTACPYDNKA